MRDFLISSTVLIAAVLLLRQLVKGKISPRLQYALWLLVVIRLLLPVPLWNSRFSVLYLFPGESLTALPEVGNAIAVGKDADKTDDSPEGVGHVNADQADGSPEGVEYRNADKANGSVAGIDHENIDEAGSGFESANPEYTGTDMAKVSHGDTGRIAPVLMVLWMAGMAGVGGYLSFYQRKWKLFLRKNRKALDGMETYRGKLAVYTVEGLPSPCLSGRTIYLTKKMTEEDDRLAHILAHEYCHYRQLDSLWVVVRCILVTVYWFHPLVWAAAYLSKQDSEFACDEAAIRLLGEEERFAYGKTLLQLLSEASSCKGGIGIASAMNMGKNGIRERIRKIAGRPKYAAAMAVGVLFAAGILAAVTFSGIKKEEDPVSGNQDLRREETMTETEQAVLPGMEEEAANQEEDPELQNAKLDEHPEEELAGKNTENAVMQAAAAEAERRMREQELLDCLKTYDDEASALFTQDGGSLARKPSDVFQKYAQQGEDALEEGLYLLESTEISGNSSLTIYGLYTKRYGCKGVKILSGETVNDYCIPWGFTGLYGTEGNLCVYEKGQDGELRSFAWKLPVANTSTQEIWQCYFCDCDEAGNIVLNPFDDYMAQIQERVTFAVASSAQKVSVYDRGTLIGEIDTSEVPSGNAEEAAVIEDVVLDSTSVGWEFGESADRTKLYVSVGLKLQGREELWYAGLNLLSFPVSCGSPGEREFLLGQAAVEKSYVNGMIQTF